MGDEHGQRGEDSYEALLSRMRLEPLGTWHVPGVRPPQTARRLLTTSAAESASGEDALARASAEAAGEDALARARAEAAGEGALGQAGPGGCALAEAAGAVGVTAVEAARLVLRGRQEFLLAFEGPYAPAGRRGVGAWRRVRVLAADPVPAVAGLLTGTEPDPRGLLLATTDGETFAAAALPATPPATSTPPRRRALVVTGVSGRIAAAAEAAARETPEQGAAVWAAFLPGPGPAPGPAPGQGPAPAVVDGWVEGLLRNRNTPHDVRRTLIRHRTALIHLLPPDERVELAVTQDDPKVRLAVADFGRDLTPAHWTRLLHAAATERERWILTSIAADHGAALAEHICALLVADPSPRVRAEAARLTCLPARLATGLTKDPDARVRADACRTAAWTALSPERRQALLTDEAAAVRAAARLRHHEQVPLSRAVFEAEGLGEQAVRRCLLAPDLVAHLLDTADGRLREALAGNTRLSREAVARLAADADGCVRHVVALRPDLTEDQRAAVPVDIDPGTRTHALPWVVEQHDDPVAMRRLAASSHVLVRRSVARARRLPPDVVQRLAWDTDHVVQLFLAESCDDAPAEMLLRIWTWWTGSLSFPGRPRTHPNFPREGLLRFADDPHGRMRRLALDDPRSTPELVARFARDRDPEVRFRAAEDPRLALADAVRLTEDPDSAVRAAALGERALPAAALAARLRDPRTAATAARNPGIPVPVIRAMAACATRETRPEPDSR
ncbi:PE-PGRS family protein [Streptomyces antimicrobicus]|uniref:PE-PGRS family protein n=1 Tax=Streptomyces antimicrobicus TaxID=2883108 RepID=A0ABS8B2G6_9ACTN|nr:PE-PGRS family protein [Streptomyces antimicrobicus]MCB5178786.1 PE-PGRS family protein [Streptomyces antimicrobicus]